MESIVATIHDSRLELTFQAGCTISTVVRAVVDFPATTLHRRACPDKYRTMRMNEILAEEIGSRKFIFPKFARNPRVQENYVLVEIDPVRFMEEHARTQPTFKVDLESQFEHDREYHRKKLVRFGKWLDDNPDEGIEAPDVSFDDYGHPWVTDGRHRLYYFAQRGIRRMTVLVRRSEAQRMVDRYPPQD